jgi:DNA-binding PadR family transcriptional regulator
LALYARKRYGYDIMQRTKEDSRGMLYGSLDRMIAAGLVATSDTKDLRGIYSWYSGRRC